MVASGYNIVIFLYVGLMWKEYISGTKRLLDEDVLSHREKAKKNRLLRNLPILPQHTEQKYEETQSYTENGLRYHTYFRAVYFLPNLHLFFLFFWVQLQPYVATRIYST